MQNSLKLSLLKLVLAAQISLAFVGTSSAQETSIPVISEIENWSHYIKPNVLNDLIQSDAGVQIIDIRAKKYVKKGLIPGAISIPFKQWRGPSERPGQPPTEERLEALLGDNGLDLSRPFIINNHTGKTIQNGRAAIVYWILKSAGAQNIAILNGGFKAWSAEGRPEAINPYTMPAQTVDLTYRREWWADPIDIFGVASGQEEGAILDARLDGHVRKAAETGKPLTSMPMAQYIPASFFTRQLSTQNLSKEGQSEFLEALQSRGITLGEGMLISVCQTGELSALSWFYASEIIGLENVRYYPDALQGWRSDGGLMFGLEASIDG